MNVQDKEYVKSHPLTFEILYLLCNFEKGTSTMLAKNLHRGLSTIWESLKRIEQNTDLIIKEEKMEGDENIDQRNTYFSVLKRDEVKATLEEEEVLQAYAKASSRLRTVPKILMEIFERRLAEHLNDFNPISGVWVKTVLPDEYIIPTFSIKTSYGEQYIDVVRIRKNETSRVQENIGKLIDLMLVSDKPVNMLIVYLFSQKTSRAYEESIHRIINGLNNYDMKLKTIIEFINDEDLVNQFFINKLSEKISDKILEDLE